jgi:DNA invertase Pin-like site-specific DNA recombinase
MRAALYARVSSAGQDHEAQLVDLRHLARQRGCEVVAEYSDAGSSNTKARRPGLDALLKDAQKRKFDIVLIATFDRIARSTRHFLQLVAELEALNIHFLFRRENIDTGDAAGRLFVRLIGWLLNLESDLNRERIRIGLRRRKLEGFCLGRQPLDVDRAAIVRDRLSGESLTRVAKRYSVSRSSVVRFVRLAQGRDRAEFSNVPVPAQHENEVVCA